LPWFVKENRRAAPRHRYDGDDTRIGREGSLTRQCQVLDISRTGVRLAVQNPDSLPETFILVLSKGSIGRPARVKWRRGNEVGAEFFKPDSSSVSRSTADASGANPSSVSRSSADASGANPSPVSRSTADAPGANPSSASRLTADAPGINSSPASCLIADAPGAVKPRDGERQKSESLKAAPSLHTQGQEPDLAKLKADGRKVVGSIDRDKARTETHCQITDLSEQQGRADQEKNSKKRMDLSRLQKKLGPKHVALIRALKDVDPESPHGQELASIIKSLGETCD
jgi:PilZ domain